jgi:hypothetical protein
LTTPRIRGSGSTALVVGIAVLALWAGLQWSSESPGTASSARPGEVRTGVPLSIGPPGVESGPTGSDIAPGPSPNDSAPGGESTPAGTVGAETPQPTLSGSVVGDLNGYGTAPTMAGTNVTVYSSACRSPQPSPSTCPWVLNTTTSSDGNFSVNVADGAYYVAADPNPSIVGRGYTEGFGGSVANLTVSKNTTVELTVFPRVTYGNASIVLPDYACDAGFLDNDEAKGTGPGCQNPVLSWTQSGAYYLTTANELAFYSFVNRTLYNLSSWIPLYQDIAAYAMIPNQLFMTQDGSYLYGWGTWNRTSPVLVGEAVNVSTDQRFVYNFTGVSVSNISANGQVQLTGWDGNDSQMTLILENGSVIDHPLWSGSQRYVGKLDYFEANNVYWEPYLNGYIDLEAEGSFSDGIEEWQLAGPTNLSLTRTYHSTWGSGIQVNGVNGIALNVTSRELSVQSEWSGLTYSVDPNGTLGSLLQVTNRYPAGNPPAIPVGPISASDRSELVASGPEVSGTYEGFGNDSWLISMVPGHIGFYSTNVSPEIPVGSLADLPRSAWVQWSQEGQFYNASYIIAPDSYACTPAFDGACTVDGHEGAPVGTIWWMWRLGLPEFPNGPRAAAADATGPPAVEVVAADATQSSIRLEWTPVGESGLINYTVAWGTSRLYSHYASVGPANDSFTLVGLAPSTRYFFSVEAWNLHFHGMTSGISYRTTSRAQYTVTFRVTGLPSRTSWNVTLGQATRTVVGSTVKFSEANGTYDYIVRIPEAGTVSGSIVVNGSSVVKRLNVYRITFEESGLPPGTPWNVTTNGVVVATNTTELYVDLSNGSYPYLASAGVANTDVSGNLTVDGARGTVPIAFHDPGHRLSPVSLGLGWGILASFLTEFPRRKSRMARALTGPLPR